MSIVGRLLNSWLFNFVVVCNSLEILIIVALDALNISGFVSKASWHALKSSSKDFKKKRQPIN